MLKFCCFSVICFLFIRSSSAVESGFNPWLTEEFIFLVDVCCLNDTQFQSLKSELISAMNLFEFIPYGLTGFYSRTGVYFFSNSNSIRSETVSSNQTFPIVNITSTSITSLQDAIRMTQQENMTSASTAEAIEHVTGLFSTQQYNRVLRKTLIVIMTNSSDSSSSLHNSYNITRDRNITVFALEVGSDVSQQPLSTLANGGISNARVYSSTDFNCSTCDLVTDLKVYLNTTPAEPDWCSVYNCDPNANCQWRWPYCKCNEGFEGDGKVCTRIYLQEFYQSLHPYVRVSGRDFQSLKFHLKTIFHPTYYEDINNTYRGIHVVDFRNNIIRYYVKFLGRFETTDVLLQRYVKDNRKWFHSALYQTFDIGLGLGMPQPVSCSSPFSFTYAQVSTASFSLYHCPRGFPHSSIQCVPHNSSTDQGLLLGAKFDEKTLNTVACDTSLSQIDTTNLDLSKLVNTSGQLQLLTAGHKLNESEIQHALNIITAIRTSVENSSLKITSQLLANMAVAISQVITGLKMNPTYAADLKIRHKVLETLNYLAHSLNMSEHGKSTLDFKTNDLAIKIQDISKSNIADSVSLAPRKMISSYNDTLHPLNASILTKNSDTQNVRAVIIYLNTTTMNKPQIYKQGMVSASLSDNSSVKLSSPNVTVEMFVEKEYYGKVNSTTFQAAHMRQECVSWNFKSSDWSTENCCLDNDLYPRTVCKCAAAVVSMQTTITRVAPIMKHSLVIIVTGSIFSGVLYLLFFFIIFNRLSCAADPFYYHRMLCLTMATTYILFLFALPCRSPEYVNRGYGVGSYMEPWKDTTGVANTTLLHFAVLSSWLLLSLHCYTTYRRAIKSKMSDTREVLFPFVVFVIAACAVVLDAGFSLGYLDKNVHNHDFCNPKDWRFITSTYLADNMCWISGKSFYFGSFICLLMSVGGCIAALALAISKIKEVKLYNIDEARRSDVFYALLIVFMFGVCCGFGQLMVGSVEASTRQTMEICLSVSTFVLMLTFVFVTCVAPRMKARKVVSSNREIAMNGLHSARLMKP